jgi:hypothetical protein
MSTIEIAESINQQLNWKGLPVRWSWGIHALKALPEDTVNGYSGGLQAKVNGRKFKGHLRIWLTGGDDYTVQLGQWRNDTFKIVKSMEGIYCDELANIVDISIESD